MARGLRSGPAARRADVRRAGAGAAADPASAPGRVALGSAAALAGVVVLVVFAGTLRYGFAQDYFYGLARAAGLAPRLAEPWRWLSAQFTFDVLHRLLGANGNAWHALPLAAHAVNAAALALLLARRVRPAAALIGAAFFAAHPALFHALYWFSAHSDVLATSLALAALALAHREDRGAWLAVPVFAAALLEKETVVLLPLLLAAWRALRPAPRRPRGAVVLALAAVAALYLAYFAVRVVPQRFGGGGTDVAVGGAYASDPAKWPATLLTYAGWSANAFLPTVKAFADAIDPGVAPWGVALLALAVAGALVPALARRGAREGTLAFAILLLPALPLTSHLYHYYLYAALPGVAALVAALADVALERAAGRSAWVSWTAGAALAALLAVNGSALVARIETMPFLQPELRSDAIVDRARIAANVIADLREARLPAGASVRLWSPQSQAMARESGAEPGRESYYETNVRAAVLDGLGARASLPGLGPLEFRREFAAADTSELWAVYRYDGHLRVLRAGELARLLASAPR